MFFKRYNHFDYRRTISLVAKLGKSDKLSYVFDALTNNIYDLRLVTFWDIIELKSDIFRCSVLLFNFRICVTAIAFNYR